MAESFTTVELLADIKQRAMIPTDQSTFSATDLLRFATDELRLALLPMLLAEREEFYLTETGATQSLVANQAAYAIPYRAAGQLLRDVVLVDANGVVRNLTRIEYDQIPDYSFSGTGTPEYFCLRNNKAVLFPTPGSADTTYSVRMPYYIRPSKLVESTAAAQVTVISGTDVTVSSVPSTFTTTTSVDFVRATGGFECLAIDATISAVNSTVLTLSAVPSDLAVGDWIALSGQSPIPQLPAELHPLLAERVAKKVLKSIGDSNGAKLSEETIIEMTKAASLLTSPRVHGEPKRIVGRVFWR